MKEAGSVLSKIGDGLKSATEEARRAAGIGVGSIAIALDRFDYAPGDSVSGKVVLGLNETVEARALMVALIGSQRAQDGEDVVFELEHELDGEKTYRTGEYSFELGIPEDATSGPDPADLVENLSRKVSSLTTGQRAPTSWRVVAWLEIPRARNVKTKVDLRLAAPATSP
jgi:hypothetical protein